MEVVFGIAAWIILAVLIGVLIGRCISFGYGEKEGMEENVEG